MASPISFSGLGSGLDTELIINALLAQKQGRIDALNRKISTVNQKQTALNSLKGTLNTFKDSARDLENVFGNRAADSSDEDILKATANGDAALGEYGIRVDNLAQQSVATIGGTTSSASEILGTGTLTINTQGGESYSVSITDSNATLADLRQAINDQYGEDLNANIIETTPGSFQLVVTTDESGADQNILGSSNFSGFATSASFSAGSVTNTKTGEDAKLTVDGITVYRPTNEIDDVIQGVTLNLVSESAVEQKLKVNTDLDEIVGGLQEFVDNYNTVLDEINGLSAAGELFSGDASLRNLKSELRSVVTRFVPNIAPINLRENGDDGFAALSQVGFETDSKTGKLSFDTEELKEALEDNLSEINNLFTGGSTSSNANVSLVTNAFDGFSGTIDLDTIADTATIDGQLYNLIREGNILKIDSGRYEGLAFQADAAVNSVTIEVSDGISGLLDVQLEAYAGATGVIFDRTNSLSSVERRYNDDIDRAQLKVDSERNRLTRIFAQAEQAISQLQGLQNAIGSFNAN